MRWTARSLPIRLKVALAIFGISAGTLVLMSLAVYAAFQRQLRENLDDTLLLRASSNMQLVDSGQSPPALNVSPDPGGERALGEATLRLFDAHGAILFDDSPAAPTSASERALVLDAIATGSDVVRTIDLGGDEDFRARAQPIFKDGQLTGVLVTGIEHSRVNEPLSVLRIILITAVPLTSVFLALGSFWVARGALSPVARITATARQISHSDLRRRIEGVTTRDEVGELAGTLNEMIGRLAEAVERERQFTADASHELRTPLAAIEASVDVTLSGTRDADDYRETLEEVGGQARILTALTRQLLLLSRLDSDEARRDFEPVNLAAVVEACVATFGERNPAIEINVQGTALEVEVIGDADLLARAIFNLLENARLHGGPTVRVDVTLERQAAPPVAVLTVQDDGPGVPPEIATEVFQRFRRGDASRSRGGSGLGLAIVAAIMALHGGSATTSASGSGTGACFELHIPLASR